MPEENSLRRDFDATNPLGAETSASKRRKTHATERKTKYLCDGPVTWVERRPGLPRLIHVELIDKNLNIFGHVVVPPELDRKKFYRGIREYDDVWVKYYMPGFEVYDVGYSIDGLGQDRQLTPEPADA